MYGTELKNKKRLRDGIGQITTTGTGNVALRIGTELPTGGWEQSGYIVLTPREARLVREAIGRAMKDAKCLTT